MAENRVCSILGIKAPLIQAPMNYISGYALCAAVSEAGALGVLGPNAGKKRGEELNSTERLGREIARVKALTKRPFGLNLVLPEDDDAAQLAYCERALDCALAAGVRVFVCVGGLNAAFFAKIKQAGAVLIVRPLTITAAKARLAQALGADLLAATGFDEGGFLPQQAVGTFTIVPEIADAVQIPVLVAGGINDARVVRAAFALGAEGVYVGTRFIASAECAASEEYKRLIVEANSADLLFVSPAQRSLPTAFARRAHELFKAGKSSFNLEQALRDGMYDGSPDDGIITVNTAVGVIKRVEPATEIVRSLMTDFWN